MKKTIALLTLLAASLPAQQLATAAKPAGTTPANAALRQPTYLLAEQLDMTKLLASPPADPAADFAEMLRVQKNRTEAQAKQAQWDDAEESMFLFQDLLGSTFTRENFPATAVLSDHLRYDSSPLVRNAKQHFKRARPYHADTVNIKPVCKATAFDPNRGDYAYPSGHGTVGYIEALALVQILPEKKDAILARADQYGWSRVVCGVHYPSDLPASKAVAYSMMGLIVNNPFFKRDLEASRKEIRKALGMN